MYFPLFPGWVSTVAPPWGWWPATTSPTTASCPTPATWQGEDLGLEFFAILYPRVMEKMGEGMRIHISSISKELLDMVPTHLHLDHFLLSKNSLNAMISNCFYLPQGWRLQMRLQGCSRSWGNIHMYIIDFTSTDVQTKDDCFPPRQTEARWKRTG